MNVLVRADASLNIGSGHIARCMALADVLRNSGAQVSFACRLLPGHLLSRLQAQGFTVYGFPERYADEQPGADIEALLPWTADIDAMAQVLAPRQRFDWLIVDHYGLEAQWETAARRFAQQVMAIDDLANRPHAVDVLLDQNFSGTSQAYAPWIGPDCRTLFGPHFALLRDEFQRDPVVIRPRVKRVIVNFGGFDAAGQCWIAMQALLAYPELEVDFIAGIDNPDWFAMQALIEGRSNWRLQTQVSDFSLLMSQADLFMGAGGGTTWERAALGLPTLCVAVAANQKANAEQLAEAGAHLYVGTREQATVPALRQAVAQLLNNQNLRQRLASASRKLVDGKGARRVADVLAAAVPGDLRVNSDD
ncbi:UDP-2,4-diacetamido-2,4,6-trideoxy-beta-L-altropyranose hydrolase [Pseudomonas sp. DWP3-1-2]|uniref:UDP-2,4-diacetamido-2,4, 6-trideoxy-beta-L-altropyranose hydrolase n=1 Tax=Pseudomonas sp. DWP3-1-2 TaxID=2804645 RepID=UPI003CEA9A8A